jgi:predicted amidophosphoribosyltransferase
LTVPAPPAAPDRRAAPAGLGWRGWVGPVVDAVLPQRCVCCNAWIPASAGLACADCHARIIAEMAQPYCWRCGRALQPTALHTTGCARCRTEHHWNLAGLARVCGYNDPIREALLHLKYAGHTRNAAYLAQLMAAALWQQPWSADLDLLVPVPMHWLRRAQRPGDHAATLAAALGDLLHVPWTRIRRIRHGPSQTRQPSKAQRLENVRGCFAPPRWRTRRFAGQTVCIVDNLVVSGATLHEVSKVLRKAGARRIYAVTVVRTPAPGDPRIGPDLSAQSA